MEVGLGPRVPTAKSERLVSVQSRDLRREPGQRARRAGTGRSPPELMRHLSHSPSGISEPRMAIGCRRRAGRAEPPGEGHTPEARRAIPESAPCSRLSLKPSAVLKASHEPVQSVIIISRLPGSIVIRLKSAAAEGRHTGRNYRVRPAARSPRNGRHWERRSSVQKNRPALTQAGIFPTGSQDRRYRPHDHKSSETWYCFGLP